MRGVSGEEEFSKNRITKLGQEFNKNYLRSSAGKRAPLGTPTRQKRIYSPSARLTEGHEALKIKSDSTYEKADRSLADVGVFGLRGTTTYHNSTNCGVLGT